MIVRPSTGFVHYRLLSPALIERRAAQKESISAVVILPREEKGLSGPAV